MNAWPAPAYIPEPETGWAAPVAAASLPARRHNMSDGAFLFWHIVLNVFTLCYYLPASVGYARYHKNRTAIFWLTFFAGWTLVGWIVALVWACTDSRIPEQTA